MTDDMNQAKRNPWTTDPEVLKQIWGEKAEIPSPASTASQRLVLQKGSIWPTEDELAAYSANALPDAQTFNREPIAKAEPIAKPMHHTPIASKLTEVKMVDTTQQLIDSVLSTKEAKDATEHNHDTAQHDTAQHDTAQHDTAQHEIFVEVTPIAMRMKDAQSKMQALLARHKG
jgi:hypothetical protein